METGHAKNVANFSKLITACTSYGSDYNPTSTKLKLTALQTLYTDSDKAVKKVDTDRKPYNLAIELRKTAYANLNNTVQSALDALISCDDVPKGTIADAKTLVKKIKGTNRPAKTKTTTTPTTPDAPDAEPTATSYSTSRQSFDMRLANFNDLIALLDSTAEYIPNETENSISALITFATDLLTKNTAVNDSYPSYSQALNQRDILLYSSDTGLVDVSVKVKRYVDSVSKLSATQKKLATSLEFKKANKKNLHL